MNTSLPVPAPSELEEAGLGSCRRTLALRSDGSWDPAPTSGCSQSNDNRVLSSELRRGFPPPASLAWAPALLSEVRKVDLGSEVGGKGAGGAPKLCPPLWSPEAQRNYCLFCLSLSVPKGTFSCVLALQGDGSGQEPLERHES